MNSIKKLYGQQLASKLYPSLFTKIDVKKEPFNQKSLNVKKKNFVVTGDGALHVLVEDRLCKDCSLDSNTCFEVAGTDCIVGGAYKIVN